MAQRVQIILEDDIDGTTADETVRFGLDGVDYEIDLSIENAEKLRDAMAQWVGHARKVSRGRGTATGRRSSSGGGTSPTEIRAWAQANGLEVSSRGRVPAHVREAFEAAQR
ncbi:histone-like nucleoid-structuring protein Lsr2 [Granulicoccus sp. GXG6511]|uniref:histone-like nucleoid-structuring protein Lsr2 n=1 Tax=Granulicoccus sp. GXG6511 TaxID=3381351 RepID=UPI003D7CC369